MPEPFKKNFDETTIRSAAGHLACAAASFDSEGFVARATDGLDALELKARSNQIVDALEVFLPDDFPVAVEILIASLAPAEDLADGNLVDGVSTRGIRGWMIMPLADYIARRGLDHLELSLDVLKIMTPRFSSEFAIRPFLHRFPRPTLAILAEWIADSDEHVRRLVSEGTRPRLPWGMRLSGFVVDPTPVIALLECLKDDPSEYVRRSVANNLNDISKDHPERAVEIARDWMDGASKERQRLVRHALRTLIKSGHPGALQLLGYGSAQVSLRRSEIQPAQIVLGEAITFELELESDMASDQALIIDYAVHHQRAGGKTTAKVFKWKTMILNGGGVFIGTKRHAIKPITTRRYYPGRHRVEILVNGQSLGIADFTLGIE
ncbi:MAG: DNA alkylation repair protein [Alphaproteobacteria bacterium]|nr:DNA alkylation repair protein [Alphaproteobacteria bacterium]